jgi:ABC-type nitrate/sulfonate/bicarbonate transport system substrate-binding protein
MDHLHKIEKTKLSNAFMIYAAICLFTSGAVAQENIVIGMPSFNFAALPFRVADVKGFYNKHGLKVQHVLMRSDVGNAALVAGDVQYLSAFNNLIRAAVIGFDVRVIFATANKQMFSLVAQPNIHKIADLKGKIIGIPGFGSLSQNIILRMLKSQAVSDKDIKWIIGNDVIFRQQLRAKTMDAALINPPLSIMLQKDGLTLLAHAADYVDAPMVGLGTTSKRIREQPEEAKRVLRALYEGLQFTRARKAETLDIAVRWLQMDFAIAASTYDVALRAFSPDGTVTDKGIMASIDVAKESGGKATRTVFPEDVADFSLIKAVKGEYQK